jgi:hypothetical protein
MWYFPSHSWYKAAWPPGQIELLPCKKKKKNLNNKQGTKKNMQQRGRGAVSAAEKGGKARS